MGLFSSKKKIYVSSSVMSLNPSGSNRRAVPSILLNGMIMGVNNLSDFLIQGLVTGRGNQIKKYYSWANKSGYLDVLGHTSSSLFTSVDIDNGTLQQILEPRLAPADNQYLSISRSFISDYSITLYADYWVSRNRPEKFGTNYTVKQSYYKVLVGYRTEQIEHTSGGESDYTWYEYKQVPVYETRYNIVITFSSTDVETINDNGVTKTQQFLYVYYDLITQSDPDEEGNIEVSSVKQMYMYERYAGIPALDNFFITELNQKDTVYPIIPFRHWDSWIGESWEIYPWAKKAYKRLYGDNGYDKMMTQIKKSDGSSQADFIYLQPGIAINTDYPAGKRYIRDFFHNIYQNLKLKGTSSKFDISIKNLLAQARSTKTLVVQTGGMCNFKNTYTWDGIALEMKHGQIGKKNYCNIFRKNNSYSYKYTTTCTSGEDTYECEQKIKVTKLDMVIQLQLTDNTYEELVVTNLNHSCVIYKGKSQSYSAYDELASINDDSGFILPLEKNAVHTIGLVRRTDIAACSFYLVANAYKVKKIKWHQRGIFRIAFGAIMLALGSLVPGIGGLVLQAIGSFFLTAGTMQVIREVLIKIFGSFGAILYTIVSTIVKFVLITIASCYGGPLAGAAVAFAYTMCESYAMGNSLGASFKAGLISGVITLCTLGMGNYLQGVEASEMFTSTTVGETMMSATLNAISSVSTTLATTIAELTGTTAALATTTTTTAATATETGVTTAGTTATTGTGILAKDWTFYTNLADLTSSIGTNVYKEMRKKHYSNKIKELNCHLNTKLKELQDKSNELLGASAAAWAQMYVLGGGALYIPESCDAFLNRGIILWTDVIELQMQDITNITNLNCNTLLPGLSE